MNNYTENQVRNRNYWSIQVALVAEEIATPVASAGYKLYQSHA